MASKPLIKDNGVELQGWQIQTKHGPILNASQVTHWEEEIGAFRLPEMVFGSNVLKLSHKPSGLEIHFNAWDALMAWKRSKLPPVKVPAAAHWTARNKTGDELVLDYDYTFTTTYCGSHNLSEAEDSSNVQFPSFSCFKNAGDGLSFPFILQVNLEAVWEKSDDSIDWEMLKERDPILFYDEVVLYEDELADCGIAICSAKVRVMARCWFVLLRFWMRVDGVLVRLRDTRVFCKMSSDGIPNIVRKRSSQEMSFEELSKRGMHMNKSTILDPNIVSSYFDGDQRDVETLKFCKR